MIVVRLSEGFANQLFQYAMGRALAERHRTPLWLDLSWFDGDQGGPTRLSPRRTYGLDALHIEAPIASPRQVAWYTRRLPANRPKRHRLVNAVLWKLGHRPFEYVFEQTYRFDPKAAAAAGPNACVEGYWQTEAYLKPVADRIRREFRLRDSAVVERATRAAHDLRRRGGGGPLVAVHVRRGDLVPRREGGRIRRNYSPPTTLGYLRSAMAQFGPDATFAVVAEPAEHDWCRRNLLAGPNVVLHEGTDGPLGDFAFMQACDHNVIGGSTFSWWAAWLNPHAHKRVVAPDPWFWPDAPARMQGHEIVPPDWTRCDAHLAEAEQVDSVYNQPAAV